MKVQCEVCGNLGQLQHISKNYYRVKHHLGSTDGKQEFEYHKQSLEYIKNVLDISNLGKDIDPIDQKTIDPKLNSNAIESKNTGAGSLARLGHLLDVQKVAGSSPVRPTKEPSLSKEASSAHFARMRTACAKDRIRVKFKYWLSG